jgi:glutathione peroxidase
MNVTRVLAFALCALAPACSTAVESQPPAPAASAPAPMTKNAPSFYSLSAADLAGRPQALSQYAGKVTLVVNTASECGYTPQYAGLEKLQTELAPRGFAVLGWPSNDFGGQEPGSAEQIQTFCTDTYHVTFPLFAKVVTKAGPEQSPIYAHLSAATGKLPNWNFCKYLVAKDGTVLGFYPSKVTPDDAELRKAIEAALAQG